MKRALYTLLFFGLLFIAAFILDNFFSKKYSQNQALNSNWVWQMEGQNLDYAFMGSSRVKSGVYVHKIDSLLQKNGLNIADHGIGIAEQYLLVNKFLRSNKTQYLFLQVDYAAQNSEDYTYPFHDYNYFPYMADSVAGNVIKDKAGVFKYWFWKYIPMFKYAEFNSEYIRELFLEKAKLNRNDKGDVLIRKGSAGGKLNLFDAAKGTKGLATKDKHFFGNFGYNKVDSVYLHNLITTSQRNGTKVILFTTPENVDNNPEYVQKTIPSLINYYKAISIKYNVPYFHFFGSAFSADRNNISGDGLHLTYESVKVFTPMMADSLKKYMQ